MGGTMVNRYFRAAAEFVKEYMQSTERPEMGRRRTASFRWRHTLRVLAAAREIGRAEGANLEIVEMAALLHDIAKLDPRSDETHHAILGSELAREFLEDLPMAPEEVERIVEAIRFHSYDTHQEDLGLETLVLKDADRLDEVGALGIMMTGIYAGRVGMDYRGCYRQGIRELRDLEVLPFYTATGREIFARRILVMKRFWHQAQQELQGEEISEYSDL